MSNSERNSVIVETRTGTSNASHDESPPMNTFSHSAIKRKLTGYVGFANFPNQCFKASLRDGFTFNLMILGASGLGKTTLVNTLFGNEILPSREYPIKAEFPNNVSLQSTTAHIEEDGVRLNINVIDALNFGDFINNEDSWKPVAEYIEKQYDSYLEMENRANRAKIVDNRVHACIYFIEPTGHSLKALDIEAMLKLHKRVNIIPVISKSDTLNDEEVDTFKQRILSDIEYNGIEIFEPPMSRLDNEEALEFTKTLISKLPYAIIGSNNEYKLPDGSIVLGREYPWGVVEVENPEHCDFTSLRSLLIRDYFEALKEKTIKTLYENYRSEKLSAMGMTQDPSVFKEVNPALKLEEDRALHNAKLAKMESDMKTVFQTKVREKEMKLRNSEEELFARHRTMRDELNKQKAELEDRKARLESGKAIVDERKPKKGFSLR